MRLYCLALWLVVSAAVLVAAVKPGEFKKCSDSSFCRRFRRRAEYTEGHKRFPSPYSLGAYSLEQVSADHAEFRAPVYSALHNVSFELAVNLFDDGNARVRLDEAGPRFGDRQRYDEAHVWGVDAMPPASRSASVTHHASKGGDPYEVRLTWHGAAGHEHEVVIESRPLRLSFKRDGVVQLILNERALLHMEHFRARSDADMDTSDDGQARFAEARRAAMLQKGASKKHAQLWDKFEVPDVGLWEETWAGVRDSKPKGPEGLALDMSFPGYDTLYGLPEHASTLSLRSTRAPPKGEADEEGRYDEPYRLMNTDVFEYESDSPMALYGSAPVIHAISRASAVSVLWMNAAETWVDLHKTSARPGPAAPGQMPPSAEDAAALAGGSSAQSSHAYFMSESGILDLFVFLGPSLERNMRAYMKLVGRTAMPQYFALGYHQSRWNYWSDDDVQAVNTRFDEADMPMDVVWLDIEWSKDHMYGVWDRLAFKDPDAMVHALDERGRKLVLIIDPHLKKTNDYFMYDEAKSQGLFVRRADGTAPYEGVCWSGDASWVDFFNPKTWAWWERLHHLRHPKFAGNARNLFVWNDMSEPAIFSGPEVTSPKDVLHAPHWENRDIHNINGVIMANLTATGLRHRELGVRDKNGQPGVERRPFVLSRAWWLGTQRYAAIWTGDNMGTWEHFANSVPMILQNGMGGMSFCGADIGGFFGNPDEELLVRWYQAGIFEPFFRAHSHIDSKRREPYLYADTDTGAALRGLLRLRYELLPVWYTAFWHSNVTGLPVLLPQALQFPHDTRGFTVDDQYYLGRSGLLVKPPVARDAQHVDMYLADDEPYYHYRTHKTYRGRTAAVPAPLSEDLPLLQQGGSIVAVRRRPRRAAELQRLDPYTLQVALSSRGTAEGMLYADDGQTYAYRRGALVARHFAWAPRSGGAQLRSTPLLASHLGQAETAPFQLPNNEFERATASVRIERIVVLGWPTRPHAVVARDAKGHETPLSFEYTPAQATSASASDSSTEAAAVLTIRDPRVAVAHDWVIDVQ